MTKRSSIYPPHLTKRNRVPLPVKAKRYIREVEDAIREVKHPQRWKEAEVLAKKHTTRFVLLWEQFSKDLMTVLPEPQDWDQVLNESRKSMFSKEPAHQKKGYDPRKEVQKKFSPRQVNELRNKLGRHLTTTDIAKIEQLFEAVLKELMDPNGNMDADAFLNQFYREAYQEGLNEGYRAGAHEVKKEGKKMRDWFAKNISPLRTVDGSRRHVEKLLKIGVKNVKDIVSVQYKGEAFNTIFEGLENGKSWSQMASELNKRVGIRKLHHWKRLVRTKLVEIFDEAAKDRYKEMRVTYVKFSPSANACERCLAVKAINGGYRRLSSAEILPIHPYCRCRWLPKWSIPERWRDAA